MSTPFRSADVLCPFYRNEGNRALTCEGVAPGSVIIQRFRSNRGFEIQHETFCCKKYDFCEIYRMLMEAKYDE